MSQRPLAGFKRPSEASSPPVELTKRKASPRRSPRVDSPLTPLRRNGYGDTNVGSGVPHMGGTLPIDACSRLTALASISVGLSLANSANSSPNSSPPMPRSTSRSASTRSYFRDSSRRYRQRKKARASISHNCLRRRGDLAPPPLCSHTRRLTLTRPNLMSAFTASRCCKRRLRRSLMNCAPHTPLSRTCRRRSSRSCATVVHTISGARDARFGARLATDLCTLNRYSLLGSLSTPHGA